MSIGITLRADGYPRGGEIGNRLEEQVRALRYIPAEFDALLRAYPGYPQPLFERAQLQLEEQQWDALLATGEELIRRFDNHGRGYFYACQALRHLGRPDAAEVLAVTAIRRLPAYVGAYEAYAASAQDRQDWTAAERRWADAARRFPKAMWPRLMRANAMANTGDSAQADRLMREVATDNPREWLALYYYADIAERRDDWAAAAGRWEVLLREFPGRPEAHERLIKALLRAGQVSVAAERFRGCPARC